jgi:hypothetical protein
MYRPRGGTSVFQDSPDDDFEARVLPRALPAGPEPRSAARAFSIHRVRVSGFLALSIARTSSRLRPSGRRSYAAREEQRARWVQLLTKSADDARIPADPEFRAAFVAYLEWGSRIGLENSQPGAHPPPHMPVPRWWWVCNATPANRASALAPIEEAAEVELPAAGEPISFAEHIKPLFRERDRQSMRFAFDLWSHDDVTQHADAIYDRLQAGTMPCDGAWPAEHVDAFKRWMDSGKDV